MSNQKKPLSSIQRLKNRIEASQGLIKSDLILKNANYLDVFSCEWRKGDIAIYDGVIIGVEAGLSGHKVTDIKGKYLVPGFIDAHVHLESSLMTPKYFQEAVLNKGTTTAICDPHELANVLGVPGIQYFLDSSTQLEMDLWIMLSSCVPATTMETNGGGEITSDQLLQLSSHPKTLGLAEMMNMPGVLNSDPEVLKKLDAFSRHRIDGHCPLLSGKKLSAYAAAGISSCHESSEFEEAREKLSKGISIWMREGSVAKDLKTLVPLLNLATSTSIGFCTDDRNPLDISVEGHIDYLVRIAIQNGVLPEVAYRSASWTVARHYGLDLGSQRIGAIAPGYQADLIILDDHLTCNVRTVLKRGISSQELNSVITGSYSHLNTIQIKTPEVCDFEGPTGNVNVIGIIEGKLITDHRVKGSSDKGVARLSVLERYGHGSKPANGYVEGFGEGLQGAIASSVGHDSHNLIAVGSSTSDIKIAMVALAHKGGGFCVVQNGAVVASLDLPMGGLMSDQNPYELKKNLEELKKASKKIGCTLREPFLQLAFLSLPVIPALKLTDRGLVNVNTFEIIDVRAT